MNREKVAVLIPEETRGRIFSEEAMAALSSFADPVIPTDGELSGGDLADCLEGIQAVITGWKSPKVPPSSLSPDGSVRFVSHAAGSINPLKVGEALQQGHIRVSHAAPVIADAVAEFTLAQILAHLRRHREMDAGLRTKTPWFELRDQYLGHLLGAQDVGIVGLGYVGRLVLELLRPFGCKVFIFDPFVTDDQAAEMGVTRLSLDQLFARCSVVSLHAANLQATKGMITKAHLSAMRPGGLLVNTARAGLIAPDALAATLREGRIFAALDTFDVEPLPENDALRRMDNVYLSPHCAGHTKESYVRQGLSAVEEVRLFVSGKELKQEIAREKAAILA
jgi:phosphoglycerate dehydrogenase-like enzyme